MRGRWVQRTGGSEGPVSSVSQSEFIAKIVLRFSFGMCHHVIGSGFQLERELAAKM